MNWETTIYIDGKITGMLEWKPALKESFCDDCADDYIYLTSKGGFAETDVQSILDYLVEKDPKVEIRVKSHIENWDTIVGGWGNKDSFKWHDDYPDTDKWTELIENDDDEGIEKWEWQNEDEMKELMMMAKEEVLYEASVSE
tara:strand:- start:213 stop:638 length:426 start_codon:yes stop_codon:yes gene_type:complete